MLCHALNKRKSLKAFKAMEEGPPRALTDNASKPLTGAVFRKIMVLNE
ncbi:hypothetical protein HDC92_003934 [Pedobacter sp. AK017]|nr:hypothetical protein [Pedobacter sp. AK017]MBB5440234.1 hypothetical protein [Pedobacter sp. AK017]